jgi:hypothetical protein
MAPVRDLTPADEMRVFHAGPRRRTLGTTHRAARGSAPQATAPAAEPEPRSPSVAALGCHPGRVRPQAQERRVTDAKPRRPVEADRQAGIRQTTWLQQALAKDAQRRKPSVTLPRLKCLDRP